MQSRMVRGIMWPLFFTAVFLCAPLIASGQALKDKLAQNVEEFDSESTSTVKQLVEFAEKFQIPMGIEWFYIDTEKPAHPIHVRKASVQDVLRMILQQQPVYRYTVSDGVVHVFWPLYKDDTLNFLNLKVPKFTIVKESLFGAQYRLKTNLQQLLHPSLGYGGGYGGAGFNNDFDVRKISFSGTNLTVRQILNRIAVEQGNALWVIRLKPPLMMDKESYYAQTISLDTGDVAPNFFWQFIPLKQIKN